MARNLERDERELARRMEEIAMTAFSLYAARSIETVKMDDVAKACGKCVGSIYRHYPNKPALVIAAATCAWKRFMAQARKQSPERTGTAADIYVFFLDTFLRLYRQNGDLLRFNQFFNVYVQSEHISAEQLRPYQAMIGTLRDWFHIIYARGQADGTLRTDLTEAELFSRTLHLMLAAVTRYAVGLVYQEGSDPEEELSFLRALLLERFTAEAAK